MERAIVENGFEEKICRMLEEEFLVDLKQFSGSSIELYWNQVSYASEKETISSQFWP